MSAFVSFHSNNSNNSNNTLLISELYNNYDIYYESKGIKVIHVNTQSIVNKLDQIKICQYL
jgi:hypothetical protein